jgi:nitrogen regulatory protein P-II 1
MKMLSAYVRTQRASEVIRALHGAGITGVTAYMVRGLSGEESTFLHSVEPFEPTHLPESVKLEIICEEKLLDKILSLIAQSAKTGYPGDGLIAVQDVDRMVRIREIDER